MVITETGFFRVKHQRNYIIFLAFIYLKRIIKPAKEEVSQFIQTLSSTSSDLTEPVLEVLSLARSLPLQIQKTTSYGECLSSPEQQN